MNEMQEEYKEFSSFEDIENWNTSEKFDQVFFNYIFYRWSLFNMFHISS